MAKSTQMAEAGEIGGNCIALRLRMANRVITKIYDDALRPFGLRVSQLSMLALASTREVLQQADICAEWQMDSSTLSRNLERMRTSGWLEKVPAGDGREHPYRITAKGKKLLKQATPAWRAAQKKAQLLLGERGVSAIRQFATRTGGL